MCRSDKEKTKYSPAVRDFCYRLQFHSTAAYNELRKFFSNRLPTIRTLQRWLRCVEVAPGISEIALGALAEVAKSYKDEGKQLYISLVSDEMGIRTQTTWNAEKERFDGFATTFNTTSNSNSTLPLAKDALVFMAVGPNFKIAIAYFFLNGLQAVDRAALTREVIRSIDATGAKVISLTSDGLVANVTVAKLLGADFKSDKPFFPRPSNPNEIIYVIFDPPHMIKLIRKYFSEHQLYYLGDKLRWDLLVKLAEKQDKDNFEMGNKLTRRHIDWKQAPMVVRVAVETISNSVADSIEQLSEDGYEDFIGSESTVQFLRLHNNVFDFQNFGEGKKSDDLFKNVLCESNIDKFISLGSEYKNFILNMTIDEVSNGKEPRIIKKKVLNSKSYMGFFGFWHNITSALGMYKDYVKNGPLDYFYNFQFSQDHLETFFSLIRSSLGANNNPNTQQFEYAFRKLLICTPHLSSKGTNCVINGTNLLTISSAQLPIQQQAKQPMQPSIEVLSAIDKIYLEFDYDGLINPGMDDYEKHTHAFLASTIEKKIIEKIGARTVSGCKNCLKIFEENTKISDSFITKKSRSIQIIQPCSSTVDILLATSTIIKNLQSQIPSIDFNILIQYVVPFLDIDRLYNFSDFNAHNSNETSSNDILKLSTHKEEFISSVIREFMHIKSKKICDRITTEEHKGRNIRKRNTKCTIFAGQ